MQRDDFLDQFMRELFAEFGPVVTTPQLNALAVRKRWSQRMVRSAMTELIAYQAVRRVRNGAYRITCLERDPLEGDLAELAVRYPGAALDGPSALVGLTGVFPILLAVPRGTCGRRTGQLGEQRVLLHEVGERLELSDEIPGTGMRSMRVEAAWLGWVRAHSRCYGIGPAAEWLRRNASWVLLDSVAEIARRYCDPVVARRAGFIVQRIVGREAPPPSAWGVTPEESRDCVRLNIRGARRGVRSTRWGVIDNVRLAHGVDAFASLLELVADNPSLADVGVFADNRMLEDAQLVDDAMRRSGRSGGRRGEPSGGRPDLRVLEGTRP